MTRGHSLAKMECIRCLGKLGVQNFRAIVLGLRDNDERVRRMAEETILDNFTADRVVEQFGGRESISLLVNLKEVQARQLGTKLKGMIEVILKGLRGGIEQGKSCLR